MILPDEEKDTLIYAGKEFIPEEWCNCTLKGRPGIPYVSLLINKSTGVPVKIRLMHNGTAADYLLEVPLSDIVIKNKKS